ncbi:MAG TPA: nitroreductase/quinone reductase family protein [Candidatus Dormibacteraeota bacterium]|nr:nitroreductase/quinone reductase family protein [Candidatus Dormibacteraeota bacterium]
MSTKGVVEAAAHEKEVTLTTYGRKSGKPRKVTIWIITDGKKLFARSGQAFTRDWPQNLMARGEATLAVGGQTVKVKPRHITDPEEARSVSRLAREKYGSIVKSSQGSEPLTLAEQATFELIPL